MKKEIRWEYWANPLGGGKEYTDDDGRDHDDPIDEYDEDGGAAVRPVIPTAGGLIPLHVYGSFATNFNFWMMHTNFNLSRRVVDVLKRVPGVETCDVITRYRARLGFAKCFKSTDVKDAIKKALITEDPPREGGWRGGLKLDADTKQKVMLLEQQARAKYKHWAIYVIPNGEIGFAHADNEQDYQRHLELFRQAQSLAGGVVFTSNDVQ